MMVTCPMPPELANTAPPPPPVKIWMQYEDTRSGDGRSMMRTYYNLSRQSAPKAVPIVAVFSVKVQSEKVRLPKPFIRAAPP